MSKLCFAPRMGRSETQSLSLLDERVRRRDETVIAPELVFLLRADRPLTPSCRIGLAGVDRVRLGRASGEELSIEREGAVVDVRLPDPRMSSRHLEIELDGVRARFRDQGSKNGSRINGQRDREGGLEDGALLELGRCFLLFRIGGAVFADTDPRPRQLGRAELSTFSPPLAATWAALTDVATTSMSIALEGPFASGKELVAHAVHELSGRTGPFQVLDGRGRPDAFDERVASLVENAANGTLFLSDVGALPPSWQLGLLRILRPDGVDSNADAAPRLVVSATEDLHRLIESGTLRSEFVARLEGARFRLPPLAERRSDLGLLVQVALTRLAPDPSRVQFRRRAVRALFSHTWPTNGQGLVDALAYGLARAKEAPIALEDLPQVLDPNPSSAPEESADPEDRIPASSSASNPPVTLKEKAKPIRIDLLGPIEVWTEGEKANLPPSKKARALLAYLAGTSRTHRREALIEMFCEGTDDPRAALRWQLSRLRPALRAGEKDALLSTREEVSLDLSRIDVDFQSIAQAAKAGFETLEADRLDRLGALFRGRFLGAMELPDLHRFQAWRVAAEDEALAWQVALHRAGLARIEDDPERALRHGRALKALLPDDPRIDIEVDRLARQVRSDRLR